MIHADSAVIIKTLLFQKSDICALSPPFASYVFGLFAALLDRKVEILTGKRGVEKEGKGIGKGP